MIGAIRMKTCYRARHILFLLAVCGVWVAAPGQPLVSSGLSIDTEAGQAVSVTLELRSSAYWSVEPAEWSWRVLFTRLSVRLLPTEGQTVSQDKTKRYVE